MELLVKPPLSFPGCRVLPKRSEDSLAKHIYACLAITCSRARRADLCLSLRRNAQIEDLRCSRSSTILPPCESTRWMTAPPECSVRQHGRHVCQQYGCFHTVKALHQPPACQEDALDTKRENLPDADLAASNCPVVDS